MNSDLLKKAIRESGITKTHIASVLEITTQALNNKLCGKSDWWREEINKLSEILHLNEQEVRNIFFN